MCKHCIFCPIAQNFLQVSPYFQHIIFQPQGLYLYHLKFGAVASLKFLAIQNIPGITLKLCIGNARRVAYVAVLADSNCRYNIVLAKVKKTPFIQA